MYAGKGSIDMKPIKWDFSLKAWVQSVDLRGGAEAKILKVVMLHIKLKGKK